LRVAEFAVPVDHDDAALAERVRAECAEQGLPEKVEDPAVIAAVATLAYAGAE
jgi:hypothetical protein